MSDIKWQTVKIKLNDHDKGEVWIDDKELTYTLGVSIQSNSGLPPTVIIKMLAEVEYEGAAVVEYDYGRWMKAEAIETGEVDDPAPDEPGLITEGNAS